MSTGSWFYTLDSGMIGRLGVNCMKDIVDGQSLQMTDSMAEARKDRDM